MGVILTYLPVCVKAACLSLARPVHPAKARLSSMMLTFVVLTEVGSCRVVECPPTSTQSSVRSSDAYLAKPMLSCTPR